MTVTAPSEIHPFLTAEIGHWIDGQAVESTSGSVFDSINPATGEVLAQLAAEDTSHIDRAVRAARNAFEGPWSNWTPYERQALLWRVHTLLEDRFEEMARLETLDMGSPITRARDLKSHVLQSIAYFATQTVNTAGRVLPNNLPGSVMTMTIKAPLGVVGGILA